MRALVRNLVETVVEPRRIVGLASLPRFLQQYWALRSAGEPVSFLDLWPQLADNTKLTPFDPHYLYQGAWLARALAATRPALHHDVGSEARLMTAISAFVPIVFTDYRPLGVTLSGFESAAGDACSLDWPDQSRESLSCLHVIEHIGLGRYGDPIDPAGPSKACAEFARVLAPRGRLYISTPIGRPRIQFNAHRIFDPLQIPLMLTSLILKSFSYVDDNGVFHAEAQPDEARQASYACGMFVFERSA